MSYQGIGFIESIKQQVSEKGDFSQHRLPKHQAPSKKVVAGYIDDTADWINKVSLRIQKSKKNQLDKLYRRYRNIVLPLTGTTGVHTKVSQLPDFKSFKKVKRMIDPFHVPDIGGKDGILTHLIRSIPIGNGTCYANAGMIASAIPGVNVVYGYYPRFRGGIPRKSYKGLSAKEQIAVVKAEQEYDGLVHQALLLCKNIGNGWYFGPILKGAEGYLGYVDDSGTAYALHAWCSYKGYHFDPFLYSIEKRYGTKNRWYSAKDKKFINWFDYRMIQETNISELTGKQLQTGNGNTPISEDVRKDIFLYYLINMMGWTYDMMVDHVGMVVQNRHDLGDYAFPVKIPSKRKWIKDKLLYPPGLFSK